MSKQRNGFGNHWRLLSLLVAMIAAQGPLRAQTAGSTPVITRLEPLEVGLGDGRFELASLGEGSDDWRPLFFTADARGIITIPDHFRSRLIRFGADLEPLAPLPCEIATPRLNYFGSSSDGGYIAFTDSNLYRLDQHGSLVWTAPFPLLTFPSAVFAFGDTVSVRLSGAVEMDGSSIAIRDTPPYTASLQSVDAAAGKFPAAVLGTRMLPFTLGEARSIAPSAWPIGRDEASLSAAGPDGSTWWVFRTPSSIEIAIYPSHGDPRMANIEKIPELGNFWVVTVPVSEGSALIYANYFDKESVIIARYRVDF
ncbi:MAG: hypothetical protein JXA15_13835 [Spirochaetales bacterium]|nr:hypothetical protein [Spirochaetales bacterium]